MNSSPSSRPSVVVAELGPTNTGKTHRAIERMLEHNTGMIGLPLRLLAREVYDRVTARVGEGRVALMTGEEKRLPPRPDYWICTVEAMPTDRPVDFLAVDEIQLAAHRERGHVFTDRLLHARGLRETWFLGADTMRPMVRALIPHASLKRATRLSQLRYSGHRSLKSLPPRSAVVAFSADRVYELAEALRRLRRGAPLLLGALSPPARPWSRPPRTECTSSPRPCAASVAGSRSCWGRSPRGRGMHRWRCTRRGRVNTSWPPMPLGWD